jgi:BolA protein
MSAETRDQSRAERVARIEAALRARLQPTHLEIEDESDRHIGHPGAASGGGHFRVLLVSPEFEGRARTERHRMVYRALEGLVGPEIHALALELFAPKEWEGRTR